jgi:prophage regulatory protein
MRDTDERLLRLRDVKQKTGLGTSTIYRRIADSTFPAPRSLGPNTVRWLESEIDAWIRACRRLDLERRQAPQIEKLIDRHLVSHDQVGP